MTPKKQKKIYGKVSEILVVNNKKLTPYIELLNFDFQNIDQAHLGTLMGVFEIKDTSEDSAYIVNFLASVAKKTYFSGNRKTAGEGFEATLSRLNLSLSEIAKHGNVSWIGKLDAALCSVSDNQINFTVAGDAKILLLRNGKLTEISNGLSSKDESNNPIKTFTDIASGKLEDGDKLILTTDDISHIFNLTELEKYALSFPNKKFVRFLKTALINELEIAGTIVLDAVEKVLHPTPKILPTTEEELKEINAFSGKTFEEKTKKKSSQKKSAEEQDEKKKEDNSEKIEHKGHIYLKGSGEDQMSNSDNRWKDWLIIIQEKLFEFKCWIKDRYLDKGFYRIKKFLASSGKTTVQKASSIGTISAKALQKNKTITQKTIKNISFPKIPSSINLPKKRKRVESESDLIETNIPKIENTPTEPNNFGKKPKQFWQKVNRQIKKPSKVLPSFSFNFSLKQIFTDFFAVLKKFPLPSAKKLKKTFGKMTAKQKRYSLGIVLFILIAPLLLFLIQNKKTSPQNNLSTPDKMEVVNEDNINPSSDNYTDASALLTNIDNPIGVFAFGEKSYLIEENKIIELSDNRQEFVFPDFFQKPIAYSFMNDLNLLFLLDDQKHLLSFSPISKKFKENKIEIPDNSNIKAIGTYLTYIYLVDASNNQIYRYPRAEGGFGDRTNWLKEDISTLQDVITMTIDDNIYLLLTDNRIVKLSKGRRQNFDAKIDNDSAIADIFTERKLKNFYILDKLNGEIISLNKENGEKSFISNQELTNAEKININKNQKQIYFITDNSLFQISSDL